MRLWAPFSRAAYNWSTTKLQVYWKYRTNRARKAATGPAAQNCSGKSVMLPRFHLQKQSVDLSSAPGGQDFHLSTAARDK